MVPFPFAPPCQDTALALYQRLPNAGNGKGILLVVANGDMEQVNTGSHLNCVVHSWHVQVPL